MNEWLESDPEREDEIFDALYPPEIRALSAQHWTPVSIARRAARFLVARPEARVLDIGCGAGKFCVVGALTTGGHFTGIEQREHLVAAAAGVVGLTCAPHVEIIHANIVEIEFADFDAFYLYNPFAEHLSASDRIDSSIVLSSSAHRRYTEFVATQLAATPPGTRVACYWTDFRGADLGFELQNPDPLDLLKFWVKQPNG